VEATFSPLLDARGGRGLLFAGSDITEREGLREDLARSVAQLESIFDVLPDSVRVVDAEGGTGAHERAGAAGAHARQSADAARALAARPTAHARLGRRCSCTSNPRPARCAASACAARPSRSGAAVSPQ
jgi:hypothetical protein